MGEYIYISSSCYETEQLCLSFEESRQIRASARVKFHITSLAQGVFGGEMLDSMDYSSLGL